VFVEEEGGHFHKHYVTLDGFDGVNYRVTGGLPAGEMVVTLALVAGIVVSSKLDVDVFLKQQLTEQPASAGSDPIHLWDFQLSTLNSIY